MSYKNRRKSKSFQKDGSSTQASMGNSSLEAMLNNNPNLSEEAATVSFATTLGGRYPLNDGIGKILNENLTLPGVMVLGFHPTYGVSNNADSSLNATALKLYTAVRAKISGARNYDHTNMFMYVVATDSLFMFWSHCQRALQLINLYSLNNRYLPRAIVEGLGFDYENLLNNQANFKLWMDTYAKSMQRFAVPNNYTLFARHSAMCSDIYVDQPSARAQIFALKPMGYYIYDEVTEEGKTMLKYHMLPSELMTFEDAREIIHAMVNALANSADVVNYSADIATAFDGSLMTISGFSDTQLEAKYDPAMLLSIHNADVNYFNWQSLDIREDVNAKLDPYLVVNPTASCLGYDSHVILDTTEGATKPVDVLMMTRFKCQPYSKTYVAPVYPYGSYFSECQFHSLPTEVIGSVVIYYYGNDSNGNFLMQSRNLSGLSGLCARDYTSGSVEFQDNMFQSFISAISLMSKFKSAPIIKLYHIASDETACVWEYISEMDTFSSINEQVLSNVHDVALISLLGI